MEGLVETVHESHTSTERELGPNDGQPGETSMPGRYAGEARLPQISILEKHDEEVHTQQRGRGSHSPPRRNEGTNRVNARLEEVLAELGRMKQKVDKPPPSSLKNMMHQVESSFTPNILEVRLPSKFRMPVLTRGDLNQLVAEMPQSQMGKKGVVGTGLSTVEESHGAAVLSSRGPEWTEMAEENRRNSSDSGIFCVGSSQANYSFFYAFDRWLNKKGSQIALQKHLALDIEFKRSQIVAAIPGTFFCAWYASQKHWLANNILGLAFCIQGCLGIQEEVDVSKEEDFNWSLLCCI
ncbi:Signal peptide peptidase [Morella rubra]|uniref:Signal peptide peptidase n=1 Tax=Morella rubra TaxID=262757 RepID=A0A6A1WJW7_9ROSI|nr:Signal peptide peptidase [Morella rubra]